jgi:diguanylate cyclase (GGDEF)-like protein
MCSIYIAFALGTRRGGNVVVSSLGESFLSAGDPEMDAPESQCLADHDCPMTACLILIVGRSLIGRRHLRIVLEQLGYGVVEATEGEDALSAYQHAHPDLIILHTGGKKTPLEQYWQLFQLADGHHTPLLLLADEVQESLIFQALEWGATDYLATPVHRALLKYRLICLIKQSQQYRQLSAENQRLSRLAIVDGLTQLANRRRFDEHIERMWRHMLREKGWLAVIFLDVDYFKPYNDTYGHVAGDTCLQYIASVLRTFGRRPLDLVARYGGEEFALVLPQTALQPAITLAEQIQKAVYALQLPHEASDVAPAVTVSLGVVSVRPTLNDTFETLVEAADAALYQAKQQGRNQVFAFKPSPNAKVHSVNRKPDASP